jgi:DNA-binding CsgD family transcriptional regulator
MEEALRELPRDVDAALEVEAELVQMASIEPAAFAGGPPRRPGFRPAGATRGERAYLAALTTSTLLEGEPAEAVAAWGRAAVRAGVAGDHPDGSLAWNNVAYPLIFSGAGDVVAQVADAEVDRASERGSVVGSVRAHAIRGMLHLRSGALREAVADARTAAVAGREAGMLLAVLALGVLVEALAAHGEPSEADEALAAFGLQGEIPVTFHGNWALHGRAWLRLAQDRPREALADFRELGRRGERWRPWSPAMYPYRSGLALAQLRLGHRDAASAAAEEELRLARRFGAPVPIGVALRTAGLIAEGPAGLGLLRRSVDVLEGSGAELERARALVELGAAVRRAGHRARARDALQEGMELAHRCAARPLAERAREELVATGARPRRMVRTGVDALTPSELRVARMAARGMTNREIAQALFVTGRTVETHLSHVYAKLGIQSRDELTGSLPAVY